MINKVSVYGAILVRGTAVVTPPILTGRRDLPQPNLIGSGFVWVGAHSEAGKISRITSIMGLMNHTFGFVRSSATVIWAAGPPTSVFDFPERLVSILCLPILKSYVQPPPPTSLVQICWEETVKSQGSAPRVFIRLSTWGNPSVSSASCMTEHVLRGRHLSEGAWDRANHITPSQVPTLSLLCAEPKNWMLATASQENKWEMTFWLKIISEFYFIETWGHMTFIYCSCMSVIK